VQVREQAPLVGHAVNLLLLVDAHEDPPLRGLEKVVRVDRTRGDRDHSGALREAVGRDDAPSLIETEVGKRSHQRALLTRSPTRCPNVSRNFGMQHALSNFTA
jgi:hypothetical protein